MVPAPQLSMSLSFAKLANQLGAEFGLTPATRSRIHVAPKKVSNAFEEFQAQKRR